ncbi:uncharacterized protein METZ01_LOCUS171162 [marine metagenome]|uniref:Uncharacterized protein n=1 Tax=marine metagenome TaxID=408172 RepID=A0A382BWY2_9ZZZZ
MSRATILSAIGNVLVLGLIAMPAVGQSIDTARTPWGDPDLQGVWSYATITPLQRPTELSGRAFLTAEEVAQQNDNAATRASSERRAELTPERDLGLAYNQVWWDRGTSTGRTSLIVDPPNGRLPALTPEAQEMGAERQESRRAHQYDSWENRPLQERCMTYQRAPPVPSGYNNTYQIFQTPEYVAILNEMIHDVRFIPVDGRPHVSEDVRQWNGDSRGHWEGSTLVVETTNYSDKTTWRGFPGAGQTLRAVERFTRLDADTIDYQFTIHDPTTYTSSWSVDLPLTNLPGYVLYEYACHEGNYSIANVLAGARIQERASQEASETSR